MAVLKPLPDILKQNLKILFVGYSPGIKSSQARHYFAGKPDLFWKLLYESRLIGTKLEFKDDKRLLDYEYGLTDVVKKPTKSGDEAKRYYTARDKERIDCILTTQTPKIAAFVGKFSFRMYDQNYHSRLDYGFQRNAFGVRLYLVPSPSGLSFADTSYHEKLHYYKNLRRYSKNIR